MAGALLPCTQHSCGWPCQSIAGTDAQAHRWQPVASQLRQCSYGRRPLRQQASDGARCHAAAEDSAPCRRQIVGQAALLCSAALLSRSPVQAAQPPPDHKVLCDQDCLSQLDSYPSQTLKSGVKTIDIRTGTGASPPVGLQIVVNYVLMNPKGLVIDSSLDKGKPYDIRVGTGQVVAGLDEGIKGMKSGGLRRVYVPGNLAFPKGLAAAPGTPKLPPATPVIFDVELVYCPGLDDE